MLVYPFADVALARRFERAEGLANARAVEARARLAPESGACWIEVAGALAMFDTPTSPITQTFGLGLFGPVTSDDLSRIESFFRDRRAPVFHEVSPLADSAVIEQLTTRGYQPFEFTSVMYRPVAATEQWTAPEPSLRIRTISEQEGELWVRIAADGWREFGCGDFMLEMGRVSAETANLHRYLAELDGRPIATAAMRIHDGVALMAGASTIPEGRRRGAQLALLNRRLRDAAAEGCDVVMMGALPGSGSQRNAERHGFRIAYTRIKWRLRS